MNNGTQQQPGRETSGHTGAGLVGSLDTGLDAGPEGEALKERARQRDSQAQDGSDATFAGGPGTTTPQGVSRIGSGTTGLNNYSPGSDLSAGPDSPMNPGQLAGQGGGERASAGINDADRSSSDGGNSLGA